MYCIIFVDWSQLSCRDIEDKKHQVNLQTLYLFLHAWE